MADFKMSYDAMKASATQIRTYQTDFNTVIKGMEAEVKKLDGQWEGDANKAFESAFAELKPKLNQFSELMGKYADTLDKQVSTTQESDIDGARRVTTALT